MDRKSELKLYSGILVISSTLLLEQIPPRGHEVCCVNGLKASVNSAAFWGLMVLLVAVIACTGEMCFFSFVALFFSLVVACYAHCSFLCPVHLFRGCFNKPSRAVMIAWGPCGTCAFMLNLLPDVNAVCMHQWEG